VKLLEHEAKAMLRGRDIPFPRGEVAGSAEEAEAAARRLGGSVVVKAQIPVSGRGKAGGILRAGDAAEAGTIASRLIGATIKDCLVESVLIEEAMDIAGEYYLSVAVDRPARRYVILASAHGGVDIEQTSQASPEAVFRHWADPVSGFGVSEAADLLARAGVGSNEVNGLASILAALFAAAVDNDAELAELNPVVVTSSGQPMAVDARMMIDDNALFRHPELDVEHLSRQGATPREIEARRRNLAYVDLPGTTGVVGNGAGLVMATVDLVHYYGGSPANFLDIGGGGDVEHTREGLLMVMEKPEVEALVVNVFGGITRCDLVAQAIVEALDHATTRKPVAASIMGTNQDEARRLLDEVGVSNYPTMEEAVAGILKVQGRYEHPR
jgi:succinyl-CoA synthetase beta subunit